MGLLPNQEPAVPNPCNSNPQLESYISLEYDSGEERRGCTGAEEYKEMSWLDDSDPMNQKRLLFSWRKDLEYMDSWLKAATSKGVSQLPAQKVEDHALLKNRSKTDLLRHSAKSQLDRSPNFGSPAPSELSVDSSQSDLETSLSYDTEEMTFKPADRHPKPVRRVNRECFAGNFNHYCVNDADDDAPETSIAIPIYSSFSEGKDL